MNYRTVPEIEIALSKFFNSRVHLIIPNVSWGLGLHECDLLILSKTGYLTEVEIKTNSYDIKRDLKKWHGHRSNLVKRLFFAIPDMIINYVDFPDRAGIILISGSGVCTLIRKAQTNKSAKQLTGDQILHLHRLASLRIWDLKEMILNRKYNEEMIII